MQMDMFLFPYASQFIKSVFKISSDAHKLILPLYSPRALSLITFFTSFSTVCVLYSHVLLIICYCGEKKRWCWPLPATSMSHNANCSDTFSFTEYLLVTGNMVTLRLLWASQAVQHNPLFSSMKMFVHNVLISKIIPKMFVELTSLLRH